MPVNTGPNPLSTGPQQWTPTSGQIYQQSYGLEVAHLSLTATINPTLILGSTVLAEISEDGTTWYTYATVGVVAGVSLAGNTVQVMLLVPTNWFYRVTATRATLGQMMLIGQS